MPVPQRGSPLLAGMALAFAGRFITSQLAGSVSVQGPVLDSVFLVSKWGFLILFMATFLVLIFRAFSFRHPFGVMSDE